MNKKDKQPKPKEQRLTPKQELFCQHYVDIGIASEAYRLAYDCTNMKQATVWRNASAMLSNNKVSTRIKEIEAQRAEESKVERKIVEKVLMDIIPNCILSMRRLAKSGQRTLLRCPRGLGTP